jgi:hypothetical protein
LGARGGHDEAGRGRGRGDLVQSRVVLVFQPAVIGVGVDSQRR